MTIPATVSFVYDESTGLWEVVVSGVVSNTEALQAFNAVVLTCRQATPEISCNKATLNEAEGTYKISVGQHTPVSNQKDWNDAGESSNPADRQKEGYQ